MRRALALLAVAVGWVAACGLTFAAVQHTGIVAGLYWSTATATTVGYGDVHARGTGGQLLAIGAMLTAIPLLASAFALLTSAHVGRHVRAHVDRRLSEHHQAIHERLDRIEGRAAAAADDEREAR